MVSYSPVLRLYRTTPILRTFRYIPYRFSIKQLRSGGQNFPQTGKAEGFRMNTRLMPKQHRHLRLEGGIATLPRSTSQSRDSAATHLGLWSLQNAQDHSRKDGAHKDSRVTDTPPESILLETDM